MVYNGFPAKVAWSRWTIVPNPDKKSMHGFYSELIYHIVLWARLNINILTLFDEQLFYYKLLSKI